MDDADEGDERDADESARLSHEGYVLFLAGLAALVTALLGAAGGEPTTVVLLANIAGVLGLGAAAREYLGRGEPTARAHLVVGLPCLAGAALAAATGVLLTAALLAVIGALSLGPVYERWRE